ncbi:MAG TPA: hypothetical protein VJ892_00780 [Candidatus Absconditabacterales bacterium]|nr:hypothetical protein [Candidatus Absconditabacterales bacterium]
MEIPQANIIQSGNRDMQFNGDSQFNQKNTYEIEEMPEIPEPNIDYNMPEIPEPDFITETFSNGNNNNQDPITKEPVQIIKSKYNIFDMFWLVNEDIFEDINKLEENQVHFISISYNMDFGNLKLTLCNLTEEAIDNHVLFRQHMTTLISGTIYPSSAFRILNSNEHEIICMEQLINKTGEAWQKERPMVQVNKYDSKYECIIINPLNNKSYKYIFKDWQKNAFEHSLKYIYNEGFQLRGQKCGGN